MKSRILFTLIVLLAGFAAAQVNIVTNPEFDDGKAAWVIKKYNTAQMTYEIKTDGLLSGPNYLSVSITQGGDAATDVAVYQSKNLEKGRIYDLYFMASASTEHSIHAELVENTGDKKTVLQTPDVLLSNTPQTFGPFSLNYRGEDSGFKFVFYMGGKSDVVVNLDAIVLTETDDPDYFRIEEKFSKGHHSFQGTTLPYRLCKPDFYDPSKKYPLVLTLHGSGECGTDNEIHILVHRLATSWADSANQKKYPCFVVSPQCPLNNAWNDYDFANRDSYRISQVPESNEMLTVVDLLDSLTNAFSVDTNRVYVTGLSLGGYGTWDFIERYPKKFAAAIPMSGGGDSTEVDKIKNVPIWDFHGEKDSVVPVSESRKMINALERRGLECVYTHCRYGDCTGLPDDEVKAAVEAKASLLYTEWKGKDHVMWAESYDYPWLFPWVFAQSKDPNFVLGIDSPSPAPVISGFKLNQNYPNPFNPQTTIEFELAQDSDVQVELFNVSGQRVRVLFDGVETAGVHRVTFDAQGLASGKYICHITAGESSESVVMTLQK
jgi:poly(3-hydroxybutyrate) depolymerase